MDYKKTVFLDIGSTVSFIDQSVEDNLWAQGTDVTLNIADIQETKDLKTKKFPQNRGTAFYVCTSVNFKG